MNSQCTHTNLKKAPHPPKRILPDGTTPSSPTKPPRALQRILTNPARSHKPDTAQVTVDDLERQLKNIMAERDKLVEIKRTLDEDLTVHRRKRQGVTGRDSYDRPSPQGVASKFDRFSPTTQFDNINTHCFTRLQSA